MPMGTRNYGNVDILTKIIKKMKSLSKEKSDKEL